MVDILKGKQKNDLPNDIDKLGRLVYNFQNINSEEIEHFYSTKIANKETGKLLSRHIEVECTSIKDMIKYQKLIDISLFYYLEKITKDSNKDNCIYTASFSISYKFQNFISNTENVVLNTSTSEKPYRISEVKTLGAYTNMEYSCWNSVDNTKIKSLFKGQYNHYLSSKEEHAFAQIISLFGCESSRNPTTYITAPMVLELADYFYYEERREDKKCLFFSLLNKSNQSENSEKDKMEIESTLNDCQEEIENLKEKSSTIKMCFLKYFPMAIKNAVSGSRGISEKLNKEKKDYFHQYDYGRANINSEKELDEKNNQLTTLWQESFPKKELTDLIKDWYDIDLIGDN